MDEIKLVTLEEWNKMPPKTQGYVFYMQAEWPESELKSKSNPYEKKSKEFNLFEEGEERAYIDVLDMEE